MTDAQKPLSPTAVPLLASSTPIHERTLTSTEGTWHTCAAYWA